MLGLVLEMIEDEDGASLVEYGILLGLCTAVAVAVITEGREIIADVWYVLRMRWDEHDLALQHPGLGSNR